MASNAMRAKATLPWLRPAAYRRSTRTLHRRDAGASSPGIAGTSGSRWRARSCACCGRASFASRYVASGRPWDYLREYVKYVSTKNRECDTTVPTSPTRSSFGRRFPARIGLGLRAVVRTGVQVRTTARTEPLTVFPAQRERRRREQPLLPGAPAGGRAPVLRIEQIDIGIVSMLLISASAKMMCASSLTCACASPRQRLHSSATSPSIRPCQ